MLRREVRGPRITRVYRNWTPSLPSAERVIKLRGECLIEAPDQLVLGHRIGLPALGVEANRQRIMNRWIARLEILRDLQPLDRLRRAPQRVRGGREPADDLRAVRLELVRGVERVPRRFRLLRVLEERRQMDVGGRVLATELDDLLIDGGGDLEPTGALMDRREPF